MWVRPVTDHFCEVERDYEKLLADVWDEIDRLSRVATPEDCIDELEGRIQDQHDRLADVQREWDAHAREACQGEAAYGHGLSRTTVHGLCCAAVRTKPERRE